MIVEHTTDRERIYKVLKHPAIWPRIAEDGVSIDEYEAPEDTFYIMDEGNTGLLIVHPRNTVTFETHVQVIPEARETALEFALCALNWVWNNTKCQKLVAEIPEIYPDVLKFGVKAGFKIEGVNEKSYLKDGTLYSQMYVGLMRPRGKENGLCS